MQVKIQQGGVWSAGICSPAADLNTDLGQDHNSWAVTSEGVVRTRGAQEYGLAAKLEEGDVLGFSYDHVELNIYCNGKNLDTPVLGIKGTVFPVFYGEIYKRYIQYWNNSTPLHHVQKALPSFHPSVISPHLINRIKKMSDSKNVFKN